MIGGPEVEMVPVSREKLRAAVDAEAAAVMAAIPYPWSPHELDRIERSVRIAIHLEWTNPELVAEIRTAQAMKAQAERIEG